MHQFLLDNRDELIVRCQHKVALRLRRSAAGGPPGHGIPLFLDQLTRTLRAEEQGRAGDAIGISGAAGSDALSASEIGAGAASRGRELMDQGLSVDQVVHDYGDLCQAITELAFARHEHFPAQQFRTLNRCLDNAIAGAVTAFSERRETRLIRLERAAANERLGTLVHELRNGLGTATLAIHALEGSNLPINGATGAVLKRSMLTLTRLVDRSLDDVRLDTGMIKPIFDVAGFVADAESTAQMTAHSMGCELKVIAGAPGLRIRGDRDLLVAALGNLLQNAFKFTHPGTAVTLQVRATPRHVHFDVSDCCGGLPMGNAEEMFTPFRQRSSDRTGLGLGLTIARKSVEADSGTLSVRNVEGVGCVFTIRLPRQASGERQERQERQERLQDPVALTNPAAAPTPHPSTSA